MLIKRIVKRHPYALVLAAAAVYYCRAALVPGRVLIELNSDAFKCIYSSMSYFRDWMTRGVFPLWNTLSMCGHTFGLHAVSFVNLFNVSAVFFDVGTAYNLVVFTAISLNGLFMYLFLRRKDVSGYAAWLGSFIWMIGTARKLDAGFFFMTLCFYLADQYCSTAATPPPVCSDPLRGSAAEGGQTGGGATRQSQLALLTLSIALYALNTNPHFVFYGCAFLFFYMFFMSRRFVSSIVPFVFAGGLVMFYYAPLFDLFLQSNRTSRHEIFVLLPTHLIQAIFPRAFNSPTRPGLDFMVPRVFQGLFGSISFLKDTEAFLSPPYLGIVPVLAALFGVMGSRRKAKHDNRFFLWAAAAPLIYLMLHPLIYKGVVRYIPLIKGMTPVGRLFYIYQFAMAVLAAEGVDSWIGASADSKKRCDKARNFLVIFAMSLIVCLGVLKYVLFQFKDFFAARAAAYLAGAQRPSIFIEDRAVFLRQRVEEFFYFFREIFSILNPHWILPIFMTAGVLAGIAAYHRGLVRRGAFKIFLSVFVIVDMGATLGFAHPSTSRQDILRDAPAADFIRRDKSLFRVMALEDKTRSFSRMFLVPEANMNYGIATPDGYEYLYLKRYVKFYELLTRSKRDVGPILHTQDDFEEDLADFVNCKYFVTTAVNTKLDHRLGYQKVMVGPDYNIYQSVNFLPRAFIVHAQKFVDSAPEALDYIRSHPDRLKSEVVLEGAPRPLLDVQGIPGPDRAEVLAYRPNEIKIQAQLDREGYLVMSETYYPGWKAFVDGRPTPIELADGAFRALRLTPGLHEVRLVYRPFSMILGVALSLASLCFLIIAFKFFPSIFR